MELHVTPENITTEKFQEAVDCAAESGKELVVEPGAYVLGTIFLRDNLTMHLKKGAVLLGTADFSQYSSDVDLFTDAVDNLRGKSMIYAEDVKNIKIYGEGVISGRGRIFNEDHPNFLERPFLMRLNGCSHVELSGFELRDSAAWTLHMMNSEDITIRDLTIKSRVNENNDGIDIDACRRVNISGCNIDTGDDAVCMKATVDRPCRDITVKNCIISTNWAAFKIGTESVGDFENVNISDCYVYDCRGGGIKLIPVDGGNARNITIQNVTFLNTTGPIFIANGDRLRVYHEGHARTVGGTVENVLISDIHGDAVNEKGIIHEGAPWGFAKSCIVISGTPDVRLKNIVIRNLDMEMAGDVMEMPEGPVPEMGKRYPEIHNFGTLPAWGVYVRHADGVHTENMNLKLKKPDVRSMFATEDVTDVN